MSCFLNQLNMSLSRKLKISYRAILCYLVLIVAFAVYLFTQTFERSVVENHENKDGSSEALSPKKKVTSQKDLLDPEVLDKIDSQRVIKVILLAVSPRSGSTYLADILSSPPRTSLWQEPLRFLYEKPPNRTTEESKSKKKDKLAKPRPKDQRYRKVAPTSEKLQMISDFMACKFSNYSEILASEHSRNFVFKLPYPALGKSKGRMTPLMLSKVFAKKSTDDCKSTKLRIMKTIRLDVDELIEDFNKEENSLIDPDCKVIMLFRDPRAILTSIMLSPDYWPSDAAEEEFICKRMVKNLDAIENAPQLLKSRVRILKYEDFVDNREMLASELYKFLNISYLLRFPLFALESHIEEVLQQKWDRALEGEIIRPKKKRIRPNPDGTVPFLDMYAQITDQRKRNFFKAKKMNTLLDKGGFRYYSTFRSSNFTHDHWKNEIPHSLLDAIQKRSMACQKALSRLGYSHFNLTIPNL